MPRTLATSEHAFQGFTLVKSLQNRFVLALKNWGGTALTATEWLRDGGCHGGGIRFGIGDTERLGRASVNVSQVHYDDPSRPLDSASALSTIVHPAHPHTPSVHLHISWTEMKNRSGYWRMMADLNPAIPNSLHTGRFVHALRQAAPHVFDEAAAQGDRYFYIPALDRHRGVAHFYLEQYNSGDFSADLELARRIGESAVDGYMELLHDTFQPVAEADLTRQLEYHTLYFFQVLTLDRGTTAGLMVHDQNDIGILGSLPPRIDRNVLASWGANMPRPQDHLLLDILSALPEQAVITITDEIKRQLAVVLRRHYRRHPEALRLQASGFVTPPTVDNHGPAGNDGT